MSLIPHIGAVASGSGGGGGEPAGPIDLLGFVTEKSTTGAGNLESDPLNTVGANLLIAAISGYGSIVGLTDSEGNSWTPLTTRADGGDVRTRLYYCINPTTDASHTFTIEEGMTFPTMIVAAFENGNGGFDGETGSAGVSSTRQPGSITPSEDNALLIACIASLQASSTIDSSFTEIDDEAYVGGQAVGLTLAYKIQTTTGAENPEFTLSGSGTNAAAMAAFRNG